MPYRRTREGVLLRALNYQLQGLYVAYSASGYAFGNGGDLNAPELDALRATWSGGVTPWTYLFDPSPTADPTYPNRVLRFTGTGRLWLNSRRNPVRVVPGDTITGTVSGYATASPAGRLVLGVRFILAGGGYVDAELDYVDPADYVPGAWAPNETSANHSTAQLVPAEAVGAAVWVDGVAGWHTGFLNGTVSAESSSAGPENQVALTIRRGRSTPDGMPAPATASVDLVVSGLLPVSSGDPVEVQMPAWDLYDTEAEALAAATRFVGTVGEPELTVNRASSASTLSFIATSNLARLGAVRIGDEPWPEETAGARAKRILELAYTFGSASGEWFTLGTLETTGYTVLARDIDAQAPNKLLGELQEASGGRYLESRDNVVSWRNRTPTGTVHLVLTSDHYAAPLTLPQASAANQVTVEYGSQDNNPRYYVTVEDETQVALRGAVPDRLDSVLANYSGARSRAQDLLGAGATPAYRLDSVTVDALDLIRRWQDTGDTVARDAVRQLLKLEVGDVVQLQDLPAVVPELAGAGLFTVEGWTETITANKWRFQLNLADLALSAAPATWSSAPADLTWADVPEAITWTAATTWRPR